MFDFESGIEKMFVYSVCEEYLYTSMLQRCCVQAPNT